MQNPKTYLINRILEFRRKSFRKFARTSNSDDRLPPKDSQENQRKGTEFEAFVVQRFDRTYFTLVEWRSDKNVNGIFPLMSKFPDLEFYFESQTECCQFAIECKWREHFYKERIWLDQFQLDNYNHYQLVTGYQTFILLGVGNIPSLPPTYIYCGSRISRLTNCTRTTSKNIDDIIHMTLFIWIVKAAHCDSSKDIHFAHSGLATFTPLLVFDIKVFLD